MEPIETDPKKRKAYTLSHLEGICRQRGVPERLILEMKATAYIFPFKANDYVVDELIDWRDIPNDPIFKLLFPQPDMLQEEDGRIITAAVAKKASTADLAIHIHRLREKYLPTDTEEDNPGVPKRNGEPMRGYMNLRPGTLVLFPRPASECFSYCGYCFRWTKATMKANDFNYGDPGEPLGYLRENPDISNVVFSGGDPLTMPAESICKYTEPFLALDSVHSICFTTKALGWWPYRFTSEKDSSDLTLLFERLKREGKHVSIIAHFSHPRELTTRAVKDAIAVLKKSGVAIRCQTPLLRGINDDPGILADLWQRQVDSGLVPYYLFLESDSETRQYYKLPFAHAFGIFKEAQRRVSSLSKTVQGPVIMHNSGKILMLGILRFGTEKIFLFKHLEHPDQEKIGEFFYAEFDPQATHIHQLRTVSMDSLSLAKDCEPAAA